MRFRFGFQKNYTKSRFYTKFTYTKSSVDCIITSLEPRLFHSKLWYRLEVKNDFGVFEIPLGLKYDDKILLD